MVSSNHEILHTAPFLAICFGLKEKIKEHTTDISKLCGPRLHSTRNFHIGKLVSVRGWKD